MVPEKRGLPAWSFLQSSLTSVSGWHRGGALSGSPFLRREEGAELALSPLSQERLPGTAPPPNLHHWPGGGSPAPTFGAPQAVLPKGAGRSGGREGLALAGYTGRKCRAPPAALGSGPSIVLTPPPPSAAAGGGGVPSRPARRCNKEAGEIGAWLQPLSFRHRMIPRRVNLERLRLPLTGGGAPSFSMASEKGCAWRWMGAAGHPPPWMLAKVGRASGGGAEEERCLHC